MRRLVKYYVALPILEGEGSVLLSPVSGIVREPGVALGCGAPLRTTDYIR